MLSPIPSRPLSLTVYCASSKRVAQSYLDVATAMGRLIAQRGHTLVYGGGNIGNDGAVYTVETPSHGEPQSLELTLPPLATIMLRAEG